MSMVKLFNQAGYEVGRITNDDNPVWRSYYGYSGSYYLPGSWMLDITRHWDFVVLKAKINGIWEPLGVYATEDEAQAVRQEIADTVKRYQDAPTPAELPEYHVPRGKKAVDAFKVLKTFKN